MPRAAFRIQRLEIEGFKAFAAPQSFEIGGNHVFVFGRNGLGKSSVVEAIRWCLFGLADREGAEVRNVFYPAGECKVELELDGPGGCWTIQRRLRPGSGRSDQTIRDPDGNAVPQAQVFPGLARLGPREGTHIIFASQQSTRRRPQADITDFDKVLYSYLRIDDVSDLLDRLETEFEEQEQNERQLADKVTELEESLKSRLTDLRSRLQEIRAAAPWPGETVPTNAETDVRIRAFVEECGGSLERADGGTVTHEWLCAEAERAIQQFSAVTRDTVKNQLDAAQTTLAQLKTANELFEDATEKLMTAQARVGSREHDLKNAVGDTTEQELLKERDELLGQDSRLAGYLAVVREATSYFKAFSPDECPVCDAGVDPADVLSGLQDRAGSDRRAAELAEALTSVEALLDEIKIAEAALVKAKATCVSVESEVAVARGELEQLLDDPADLSNSDSVVEHGAERIRQLEHELRESGALVASKQNALSNLRTEARFQLYRSREAGVQRKLGSGLEPAREAHREFADVLEALRAVREALQESFNNTLNETLPNIDELMTRVYGRLTQQTSFPKVVVEPGASDEKRALRIRVTAERTPGESFEPSEVLNGQAFNAMNLVPYFVFSQFQAEALELDCLLIDDPSQSFDTSRVQLLMEELATAATHAQLIVASHEEDRFTPFIDEHFPLGSHRVLRATSFTPDLGPTFECAD